MCIRDSAGTAVTVCELPRAVNGGGGSGTSKCSAAISWYSAESVPLARSAETVPLARSAETVPLAHDHRATRRSAEGAVAAREGAAARVTGGCEQRGTDEAASEDDAEEAPLFANAAFAIPSPRRLSPRAELVGGGHAGARPAASAEARAAVAPLSRDVARAGPSARVSGAQRAEATRLSLIHI